MPIVLLHFLFPLILHVSDGVLSDPSGSTVIKPCKDAEIRFYESTFAHPDFFEYIPKFMGTLSLLPENGPAHVVAAALTQATSSDQQDPTLHNTTDPIALDQTWTPSGGAKITTETAIMLENVAEHYQKPNILDVKLGARLWGDDAPREKREKLDRIAEETTSKGLGIRISGMRVWEGLESTNQSGLSIDGYRAYDKDYGRTFTAETVRRGFETFFRVKKGDATSKAIKKVITRFLEDLEGLRSVLEAEECRIYSSSLLFVYEGDPIALQEAFVAEKHFIATHGQDLTNKDTESAGIPSANDSQPINGKSSSNGKPLSNGNLTPNGNPSSPPHQKLNSHPLPPTDSNRETQTLENDDETDDETDAIPLPPPTQAVKLIDFAHADWTPGQGRDRNLLHGINSVIEIFSQLL